MTSASSSNRPGSDVATLPGPPATGTHRRNSAPAFLNEPLVARVLKDAESVDSPLRVNYVSVSKVKAEHIRVLRLIQGPTLTTRARNTHPATTIARPRQGFPPPSAYRLEWNPRNPRNLAVVQTLQDQPTDQLNLFRVRVAAGRALHLTSMEIASDKTPRRKLRR
jgi:hypothetical protein